LWGVERFKKKKVIQLSMKGVKHTLAQCDKKVQFSPRAFYHFVQLCQIVEEKRTNSIYKGRFLYSFYSIPETKKGTKFYTKNLNSSFPLIEQDYGKRGEKN